MVEEVCGEGFQEGRGEGQVIGLKCQEEVDVIVLREEWDMFEVVGEVIG